MTTGNIKVNDGVNISLYTSKGETEVCVSYVAGLCTRQEAIELAKKEMIYILGKLNEETECYTQIEALGVQE